MIVGEKVHLVAIEREHLPVLMKWRNLPEFRKYFREFRELNMENQLRWFEKVVVGDPNTFMFSILDKETLELIGCCGLCYTNWVHRHSELSFYIGKDESYVDETYALDVCRVLLDYGFGQLGLNKIWTEIYGFDERKRTLLVDRLGFKVDGVLRQNYFYDAKWHDSLLLSTLSDEFEQRRIK